MGSFYNNVSLFRLVFILAILELADFRFIVDLFYVVLILDVLDEDKGLFYMASLLGLKLF